MYHPHRPTWVPTAGPAHDMRPERQEGDPLGATTYPYGREPTVWVYTDEDGAPGWRFGIVVAKQPHRGGTVVQVELTLGGSGHSRFYWWGRDNIVAAEPPRA